MAAASQTIAAVTHWCSEPGRPAIEVRRRPAAAGRAREPGSWAGQAARGSWEWQGGPGLSTALPTTGTPDTGRRALASCRRLARQHGRRRPAQVPRTTPLQVSRPLDQAACISPLEPCVKKCRAPFAILFSRFIIFFIYCILQAYFRVQTGGV